MSGIRLSDWGITEHRNESKIKWTSHQVKPIHGMPGSWAKLLCIWGGE